MQMEYVAATVMVPQEIQIPTLGQCTGGCGAYIVSRPRWASIKREVRRQLRGKFKSEASRQACRGCYTKLLAVGDHIDLPSRQITDEVFAEEYNLMRQQSMTDYDVRIALGMTVAAFEKALERGRTAGRVTEDRSKAPETGVMARAGGHSGGSYSSSRKLQTTRGVTW
jgi:hypothetical protein